MGSIVGVLVLGTMNNFVRMGRFADYLGHHPLLCHLDPKAVVKAVSTTKIANFFLPDLSRDLLAKIRMVYLQHSFSALNIMNLLTGFVAVVAIILSIIYLGPAKKKS